MVKKGIQKFEIILDKQPSVYYIGETVSGRVRLELQKPIKIKCIQANLFGRSNMYVRIHSRRSRRKSHTRHVRKHETFIKKAITLWGDGKKSS